MRVPHRARAQEQVTELLCLAISGLKYEKSFELETRPDGRAGMCCDCEGVDLSSLSLANFGL